MKAILILDEMPKSCLECPLNRDCICVGTLDNSYGVWGCYVVLPDEDEKPYWCPLKEMPQEKEYREIPSSLDLDGMRKSSRDLYLHRLDVDNSYVMGWNDCIKVMENGNTSSNADELFHDLLSKLLEKEK